MSQTWHVDNLKVTNNRGKADRLVVEIKLFNGSEIVATSFCTVGDGIDKIPEDITVTVDCVSSDPLPDGLRHHDHAQLHEGDTIRRSTTCIVDASRRAAGGPG